MRHGSWQKVAPKWSCGHLRILPLGSHCMLGLNPCRLIQHNAEIFLDPCHWLTSGSWASAPRPFRRSTKASRPEISTSWPAPSEIFSTPRSVMFTWSVNLIYLWLQGQISSTASFVGHCDQHIKIELPPAGLLYYWAAEKASTFRKVVWQIMHFC